MDEILCMCALLNLHFAYAQRHIFTWRSPINVWAQSVVQSIVSLMSLFVVKILTVLVSTISNSQLFLLKKCE